MENGSTQDRKLTNRGQPTRLTVANLRGWPWSVILAVMLVSTTAGRGFALDSALDSPPASEAQVIAGIASAMKAKYKLTESQSKGVAAVMGDYIRQVQALKDEGVTGEPLQREMKDLREDLDSSLANYLSDEQMTLWRNQAASSANDRIQPRRLNSLRPTGAGASGASGASGADGVLQSATSNTTKTSGIW